MSAASPITSRIDSLPSALAPLIAARRWVVWRWEARKNGEKTKVPYRAEHPSAKAASDDPATWSDYETARDVALADQADGIGYAVRDDDVCAFDLDDCIGEAGEIAPWAWNLIDECDSYVERTISGTGLRILGIGAGEKVHRSQKVPGTCSKLETFRKAERYIVVTGVALQGFDSELRNIDIPIDGWVSRLDAENRAARERARAEAQAEKPTPNGSQPTGGSDLPPELDSLIRFGVGEGHRSTKFMHVVGWLKDRGHSLAEIETMLAAYPDGIAAKYAGRLRAEIDRAFDKAETKTQSGAKSSAGSKSANPETEDLYPLIFHGDFDEAPLREWTVDEMLPKVGTAILAGQWGTYKTFCGFDLSAAVIVGSTFAGRQIKRPGAVLWIAVEGQNEVRIRLAAVAEEKIRPAIDGEAVKLDPERLPFAWMKSCPKLSDEAALPKLRALIAKAVAEFRTRFDLPLSLVIIDTLSPAAEFRDANDTAENQRVMTVLKTVAVEFDTLILCVDHMGKDVSTGTRNSSVKEADVDAVIALLGEKDLAGNVANPRLAMRKVRGAPTGWEVKFNKRVVTVGEGYDVGTTLVVDWLAGEAPAAPRAAEKPLWTTAAERTLKGCLERALIEYGSEQQPHGREGAKVRAVHLSKVRAAFVSEYAVDVDDPQKAADAKRNAFKRAREGAIRKGLVQTKQIGASLVDWIWMVRETSATADSLDG